MNLWSQVCLSDNSLNPIDFRVTTWWCLRILFFFLYSLHLCSEVPRCLYVLLFAHMCISWARNTFRIAFVYHRTSKSKTCIAIESQCTVSLVILMFFGFKHHFTVYSEWIVVIRWVPYRNHHCESYLIFIYFHIICIVYVNIMIIILYILS